MRSSIIKIIIAVFVAVAAGGGYLVYAQPDKGKTVYIAGENITKGETVKPENIRQMIVRSDSPVPQINIQSILGKQSSVNIKKGEWITPSMFNKVINRDERYYSLTLKPVEAGGPLLKPGIKVDVWKKAGDAAEAQKILSDVLVLRVDLGDKNTPSDGDVTVVLAMTDDTISVIATAEDRNGVFLIPKGNAVS